jgi:hypothetical protein
MSESVAIFIGLSQQLGAKNTKIIGTCSFHPDFAVSKVKYGLYMKNAVVYAE